MHATVQEQFTKSALRAGSFSRWAEGMIKPDSLSLPRDEPLLLYCDYCTSGKRSFCVYSEETECRFCHGELPDWRAAYNLPTADPVMTVSHNNRQHLLEVKPGEAGKLEFQANIRKIFGLGLHDVIELDFGCKAPGTGAVWLQHCTLNPKYSVVGTPPPPLYPAPCSVCVSSAS